MKHGDKIGIVCCSNGISQLYREKIVMLERVLKEIGLVPVFSNYIYEKKSIFSGTAKERAEALMNFYKDSNIKAIFDISGGDIANEILPYLDFNIILDSGKQFWGYSDLTTIINSIYTMTGRSGVLYQVRNIVEKYSDIQKSNFSNSVFNDKNDLYEINYSFEQGESLEGIVIGGNIRCFLKLAGTKYWPDLCNKILLLEALHGMEPQITTYLSQLSQLGVFDKINGILLGTFTEMSKRSYYSEVVNLVKNFAGNEMPIVITNEIGHSVDSKAIIIGKDYSFSKNSAMNI